MLGVAKIDQQVVDYGQAGRIVASSESNQSLSFQRGNGYRGLEMKMPYHVTRHGEELVYELRTNQADSNYCLLHGVGFTGRVDRGVCAGSGECVSTKSRFQPWVAQFFQPP